MTVSLSVSWLFISTYRIEKYAFIGLMRVLVPQPTPKPPLSVPPALVPMPVVVITPIGVAVSRATWVLVSASICSVSSDSTTSWLKARATCVVTW